MYLPQIAKWGKKHLQISPFFGGVIWPSFGIAESWLLDRDFFRKHITVSPFKQGYPKNWKISYAKLPTKRLGMVVSCPSIMECNWGKRPSTFLSATSPTAAPRWLGGRVSWRVWRDPFEGEAIWSEPSKIPKCHQSFGFYLFDFFSLLIPSRHPTLSFSLHGLEPNSPYLLPYRSVLGPC